MGKGGSTKWFHDLYGFDEGPSFSKNRAMFRMDGDTLICPSSPFPHQHVGPFSMPSVAELRDEVAASAALLSSGGLHFSHMAAPTGVQSIILDPANAGAVFQAASQFNCLEMVGPGVSPRQGIACYALDPTQGPKCALACPAGTIFRNYLWNGEGQGVQQIDTLSDVGLVLGNTGQLWQMQNGYALPTAPSSLSKLNAKLLASPELAAAAEAAVRVGVHWDTQAKPPHTHRVAQVYASAVPVAYSRSKSVDWEPLARIVLRGAYYATIAAACCKSAKEGGRRIAVYLTMLGGGAFGNRIEWIRDAMSGALDAFRDAPLDVVLVHYGSRVSDEWASALPARL
uniref:Macro domain-containing protein n=1 Tax=Haptolina ericina TaxID=156174 RepID=A0A7S3AFC1_9EUKA|mmetsp:Transcript_16056/g.35949  ORF Transcript_16056/g.35949 Transcript_16056/m.35949 type:complete len:341 (+) Transcript_16056:221-1243(+)